MSTALQHRQQGERLEQLDSPSLPQTPSKPKRPLVISVGTGLGLMLGLCLAGIKEARSRALHTVKDVREYSQIAVLGDIPLFERAETVRSRRKQAWFAWAGGSLAAIVVMASSVGYYYAMRI